MSKKKIPNIMYGRLQEAVNISSYSFERAMDELDWLLDEERWKEVGDGYNNINEFVKTISLSEFKIDPEQRKGIAKKLSDLNVSQTATAGLIGVNQSTIHTDLKEDYVNPLNEENEELENEEVTKDDYVNPLNEELEEVEVIDEYESALKNIETKIETITDDAKKLSRKIMSFNGELFEMEVESLKSLQSLYALDTFGDLLRAVDTLTKYFGYQINDLNTQQNEKQNEIS